MTLRIVCAFLGVFIAGCAGAQIQQQAQLASQVRAAAQAKCDRIFPEKYKRPVSPRIECLNQADLEFADAHQASTGNNPFYANTRVLLAKRSLAAQRYDAGKSTEAEYELEVATAATEFTKAVDDYQNNKAIVAAAQQQANAATSLAITASLPKTQTCNVFGDTVTCY